MFSSSSTGFFTSPQPSFLKPPSVNQSAPSPHFGAKKLTVEQVFEKLNANVPIAPKAFERLPASQLRETSSTGETVATRLLRLHAETTATEKKEAVHSLLRGVYQKIGPQAFLGSATYFAKTAAGLSEGHANALLEEMVRVARDVPEHLDDAKTAIKSLKEKKQSRSKKGQLDNSARLIPYYEQFEAGISKPKTPLPSPRLTASDTPGYFSTFYNAFPNLGITSWFTSKNVPTKVISPVSPKIADVKAPPSNLNKRSPFVQPALTVESKIPELDLNLSTTAPKPKKKNKRPNAAKQTNTVPPQKAVTRSFTPDKPVEEPGVENWALPKGTLKTRENLRKTRAELQKLRTQLDEYQTQEKTQRGTHQSSVTQQTFNKASRHIPDKDFKKLSRQGQVALGNIRRDSRKDREAIEVVLETLRGRKAFLDEQGNNTLNEIEAQLAKHSGTNARTSVVRKSRARRVSKKGVNLRTKARSTSTTWRSVDGRSTNP